MKKKLGDERIESVKEKLQFFLSNKIKAHIDKYDESFLNGFIIKKIDSSVYKFKDDVLGEVLLFVSEIYRIMEFREKENKSNE